MKTRLNEGTKIRVLKETSGHCFDIGEIVKIVCWDGDRDGYYCIGKNEEDWWMLESEFEIIK